MELKPGYKQSEVGVIPEDWETVPIGDLATFMSGTGISITKLQRESSDSPVPVSGGNGIAGYTATPLIDEPSVVVGRVGQKCGQVYLTEGPAWITDNALYPRRVLRPMDVRFLALALEAVGLNEVRNRNDLPLVTQSILHAVRIAWPGTVHEQRAIATALHDVDALLEALTRLIAKKRDLKQAAMQHLLTGQARLPDFRASWEVKRLGDLGVWKGGSTPSMSNPDYWTAGEIPWASSGDIKTTALTVTAKAITRAAVKGSSTTLIEPGAILIVTRSGILRRYLPVARNAVAVAINQDIKALVPDDSIAGEFLLQALLRAGPNILASCLKVGTTVESIEYLWLKRFGIAVPGRDEQAAIATMLTEMDDELAALETRLTKTRALKLGMMQELLTGRTRLV